MAARNAEESQEQPVRRAVARRRAPAAEHEPERPSEPDPLRVLLWCNYDPWGAATICDHINALVKHSRFDVTVLSRIGTIPDELDLQLFDVVVIHYSLAVGLDSYISSKTRHRLAACPGLKVLFIQDEYRFVEKTRESIRQMGISLVFTCVPAAEIPKVYPPAELPGVTFINVLTGYVPAWLTVYAPKPLAERRIDVGYRGRDYPAWHGRAGLEKVEIGRRFLADARGYGLRCDIRWKERDRLYGAQWRQFLQSCRATLAVESGASVFDFEGNIGPRTETFERLLGKAAKYEVVRQRFFGGLEDTINLAQVSPRVFEAVALRTLLIMYEGQYSGVLKPWTHYIPLKKDHSNMAEVVKVLRDDMKVGEMIATAFADIAVNERWSYTTMVKLFDEQLARLVPQDRRRGSRQAAIEDIRRRHPVFLVDNPHELRLPRSAWMKRQAIGVLRGVRARLLS